MADNTTPDDPSIEEILGSIRRIISEDDEALADDEEPLELTNKIDADGTIVNAVDEPRDFVEPEHHATPISELSFADDEEEEPPMAEPESRSEDNFQNEAPRMDAVTEDALISHSTATATADLMSRLARHTAVSENGAGGPTIETMVREMLKPLLKDWLDQNLPDIVQKSVERELERLSRRV